MDQRAEKMQTINKDIIGGCTNNVRLYFKIIVGGVMAFVPFIIFGYYFFLHFFSVSPEPLFTWELEKSAEKNTTTEQPEFLELEKRCSLVALTIEKGKTLDNNRRLKPKELNTLRDFFAKKCQK